MAKKLSLMDFGMAKMRAGFPRTKVDRVIDLERVDQGVRLASRVTHVLHTGIRPFDDRIGGFPFGKITEVFGLESCGKSAMGIRAAVKAATQQIMEVVRREGKPATFKAVPKKDTEVLVLHIDNEQSVDETRNEVDGVTYQSCAIMNSRVDAIEDMFKMAHNAIRAVEEFQDKLKKEKSDKLCFGVIVVDTIASTSTLEELSQEWDKVDYDRRAKAIHRGLRILVRRVQRANVAMICMNQVHSKVQGYNPRTGAGANSLDNAYTSPGGMGLRYYSHHRVFMHKMDQRYKLWHKSRYPDGELIAFWAVKNRIMSHRRPGHMALLFGDRDGLGGGFNDSYSILETLLKDGFAEATSTAREITFKFGKHGVPMTTFGDQTMSLDEQDEQEAGEAAKPGKKLKDPKLGGRHLWPEFYAQHKADLDALYLKANEVLFANKVPFDDEDEDDSSEDGDPGEQDTDEEAAAPAARRRRVSRLADDGTASRSKVSLDED